FCTITLLFALSKHTHTHTSTRPLSCTTHPHYHKNIIYFFALSTPAAQDHFSLFTFLLDIDTVTIIAFCTIGSDPFLYLYTPPIRVNMFSLCVCDLCMYVCEVYKCISYWMTYISLGINKVSIYLSIYLSSI